MQHYSYIILTKKPSGRKPSSSVFSSLLRPTLAPEQTLQAAFLQEMEDSAGQFQTILAASGIKLERVPGADLVSQPNRIGLIERYCSLSENPGNLLVKDLEWKPDFRIGNQYCQVYTLAVTDQLPAMCGSRISYDKYSTDRTKFPIGFAAKVGLLLNCNHIYNQFILIGDAQATIKKM